MTNSSAEMRRTTGSVTFSGSTSLCAQTPWIQNATVREVRISVCLVTFWGKLNVCIEHSVWSTMGRGALLGCNP